MSRGRTTPDKAYLGMERTIRGGDLISSRQTSASLLLQHNDLHQLSISASTKTCSVCKNSHKLFESVKKISLNLSCLMIVLLLPPASAWWQCLSDRIRLSFQPAYKTCSISFGNTKILLLLSLAEMQRAPESWPTFA